MDQGGGDRMDTDPIPGSMGQIDSTQMYPGGGGGDEGFEDEPPLLQELGIDFELIKLKVGSIEGRGCGQRGHMISAVLPLGV